MREITKTVSLPVDGKPVDFRLTKLDAFSGASLPESRVIPSEVEGSYQQSPAPMPNGHSSGCHPERSEGSPPSVSLHSLFSALPDSSLHTLMRSCLEHAEVLLPAGYCPVMIRGEWSYPELSHDPLSCLKLTLEEVLWTLDGFFGEGGSVSRAAGANS